MTPFLATKKVIFVLLGAALFLRLLLAYVILPNSGYQDDIDDYSRWALVIASGGPGKFYAATGADYPPGYIYVLWPIGLISNAVGNVAGPSARHIAVSLVKVPPIIFDLGVALLLYRIVLKRCADNRSQERSALTAAALYLFNPVVLYDSAVWGQTDTVGALLMLLGVLSLSRWPPEAAAAIAVVAAMVKPQFGVVLAPIILIILMRRHLLPRTNADALAKPYSRHRKVPLRFLTSTLTATAVFYLIAAPFGLNARTFVERMTETAQRYKYLSVNAFNPWALVSIGERHSMVFAGVDKVIPDIVPIVGSLTGFSIGTILLVSGFLFGMCPLYRRDDSRIVALVIVFLSMCFFVLPTRVHERYLFPVFAVTPLLATLERRWLWAMAFLAIGSFMNLHAVLTLDGSESVTRLPFGSFVRSPPGILISIAFQTGVFLFTLWNLSPNVFYAEKLISAFAHRRIQRLGNGSLRDSSLNPPDQDLQSPDCK